ncbi:MAG: 5-bromo-4-chloroindolyl phosphate hydrolysis family protein [Oscillospiraceae bacterium]|nr:5-bromo-4-chloroindolyl phosphate hydrolysis family protein [Oscillospiraceae bacterium]
MIELKQKSVAPIYSVAAVWTLYCVFFPLYKTWHFIIPVCIAVLTYIAMSAAFPGKITYVEASVEPKRSGDERIDALLAQGESAIAEMKRVNAAIGDDPASEKIGEIIIVIDKIFKNLLDNPKGYNQIKRFSDFYLPATIKLLHAYEKFLQNGIKGESIVGSMERINASLNTILGSYVKFLDSLFQNQAIDIETDIRVLENMLRSEGLLDSDFGSDATSSSGQILNG